MRYRGRVISDNDLDWLAGLSDAEACFQLGMNKSRHGNVVVVFQIGLVRHDVVRQAHSLIAEIVGESVPEIHVRPATATQREFYSITVAAKKQVLTVVETLCPRLHGKRAEALAAQNILGRAAGANYSATELDRQLCDLSHQIKKGDLAKKALVATLVGQSLAVGTPTTAWLAGMFDGDGSVCVLRGSRSDAVYFALNVNISSSDRPALDSLRDAVATAYKVTSVLTRAAKGGARPSYCFNISAEDIERFLIALRPHLRVKAAEADVMLDVCRGKTSREVAYGVLRALKQDDDPDALLGRLALGGDLPVSPGRVSRMEQYRRPTYDEMKKRGLWSSNEARQRLGGIKHAVWVKVTDGLTPDATIGNKKYYAPKGLREHVTLLLGTVRRVDARDRIRLAMESWEEQS